MKFFSKKEYSVSVDHEDWVAPEETLVDSLSNYSDLEQPISSGVFRVATMIIIALFLVIASVSFNMSILSNAMYADLSLQNKTVNFAISPPRGLILDRQGQPLVKNVPSFDLVAVSRDIPKGVDERNRILMSLSSILGTSSDELSNLIAENTKKSSLFVVASDLTKEKVLSVTQLNPRGFTVVATTKRSYLDSHEFSTVIGYTGKVNKSDLGSDSYYLSSDVVGRAGIESQYELTLRGTHGRMYFGQGQESGVQEEPKPGQNIVLNIDADVQKQLYSALYSVLREANLNSAAAIVQDPRDGSVLGMVSFPGYDNNIFNESVSQDQYEKLFLSAGKPLFNRAISGLYNPGSTIKPFFGMAGLQEKVITPRTTIQDCINITIPNPYKPDEPSIFKNWREDFGPFNLRRSIADSCNVFFFTVGGGHDSIAGLGITKIVAFLKKAFADVLLGIDLPGEAKGFIPTPEWKEQTEHAGWFLGDTYNVSIGQGNLILSPLWINTYISAVANGGTIYKPRVANRIVDGAKNTVQLFPSQELGKLPFSPDVIREVHNDMQETVLSGTAKLLQDLPVSAGAKTGTAEVIKHQRINSLFTAFAPLESPQVTITVLVEGSPSNEGYAIRAANNFLKWYFDPARKQQ